MREAELIDIGKMRISRYATTVRRLEQRSGFHRDPFALARSAAGGAMQRS